MFLFLDFVMDIIYDYADVFELCLTSTESIEFLDRYYLCHTPTKLPFPSGKLNRRSATAWDKFTSYLLSKNLFYWYPESGMRLCVLMDFLKAKQFDIVNVPDPRYSLYITSFHVVNYEHGKFCRKILRSGTKPLGDCEPLEFSMGTKEETMLHGIMYEDHEYAAHVDELLGVSDKLYFSLKIDLRTSYREDFHVVESLGRTWIIVFLYPRGVDEFARCRCKLQLRGDLATGDLDMRAFKKRFPTKWNR
jgi:hypothetical protein